MWVLIWTAVLFSLTDRGQAPQPKASPWTITFSPAEITVEKGQCAVISCTFTHPDNIKPTTAIWFKCPRKGRCEKDKNIIFHSETPYKAQQGFKQRVSLLETDLTKKNCSVIINDIRENDAGEYQFRLLEGPLTYPQKMNITVTAMTQKPSVLTPALTEGEPATLTCTALGICSRTPPSITWTWRGRGTGDNITELRDNTTIQEKEDLASITTTHFSKLTFTPSAKHHSTKVTCLVTFNGTIISKKTVTLNVAHVKKPGCNHTNTTVECVCRNEAGRVREKLQVTQIEKEEKQEGDVSKDIMAMLSDLKLITAFVIGAALSATICCIFLCLKGKCKRRKERIPKDSDSKSPFMNLEMVACEGQQMDEGQAVGCEQTPLQVELREGAENRGPQTSGATGKSTTREEPNEVDYARINYSLLKKKTPEEAEKKTTTTETDYAEIKREKNNEEEEDGGEGSGVMEEVEWEEGEEMIGKDEGKENGEPVRETDEDTALYSNVKAIMGGE
uniref:Ig-like domain-containing protein n=1 Tax=Hucho hucho TaxID=62062 RepID=A0A4W5RBF8_9TELE